MEMGGKIFLIRVIGTVGRILTLTSILLSPNKYIQYMGEILIVVIKNYLIKVFIKINIIINDKLIISLKGYYCKTVHYSKGIVSHL